jgi:hypothetical protein
LGISGDEGFRKYGGDAMRNMKLSVLLLLILLTLGCAGVLLGTKYTYEYDLTSPTTTSPMTFEDDIVRIKFSISDKSINFTLTNKTSDVIRILWDDASIVQFGKAHKIMHSGVKYIDRNEAQPATTVPPNSSIDDLALPSDNIYWRDGYYSRYSSSPGGWEEHDLFPTNDLNDQGIRQTILSAVGQKVTLYLPIQHQGNTIDYSFEFTIRDINPISGSGR